MKLLVLGDSHTKAFVHIQRNKMLPNFEAGAFAIPGATAQGIKNVHSQTQALNRFKEHVNKTKGQYDWVAVMLGEVDCGFAIWYRAEQHGLDVDEQLKFAVEQYTSFVKNDLTPVFGKKVLLCGAHLPTLRDNKDNTDLVVKRARMTVKLQASYRDRTDLTLKYNSKILQWAVKNGYKYGDITRFCIDPKTKLMKDGLATTGNHHLPIKFSSECWTKELQRLFSL